LLAEANGVETFVVFGAVHRRTGSYASVFCHGAWHTPLGDMAIDEELAAAVVGSSSEFVEDPEAHLAEHSIEVEVPFIQRFAPGARLLPIMMPPLPSAHE